MYARVYVRMRVSELVSAYVSCRRVIVYCADYTIYIGRTSWVYIPYTYHHLQLCVCVLCVLCVLCVCVCVLCVCVLCVFLANQPLATTNVETAPGISNHKALIVKSDIHCICPKFTNY